jgi:hypothetical protein
MPGSASRRPGLSKAVTSTRQRAIAKRLLASRSASRFRKAVATRALSLAARLANFLGVTVRDITQVDATVLDKYPQYKNVGYLSRGQIWVEASVAVGANDPVHYDTTTGAWKISGGIGPIVGARYVTSGAAGDRVVIELQAR